MSNLSLYYINWKEKSKKRSYFSLVGGVWISRGLTLTLLTTGETVSHTVRTNTEGEPLRQILAELVTWVPKVRHIDPYIIVYFSSTNDENDPQSKQKVLSNWFIN